MACTPTPAKTLYGPSLSTSFSPSVSDLPSSVKTLLSTECAATATLSDDSTTCVSTTTVELLSTVAGELNFDLIGWKILICFDRAI